MTRRLVLFHDAPLGYELPVERRFELELHRRPDRDFVRWGAGKMGEELDLRILFELYHGDVEGLALLQQLHARVIHDAIAMYAPHAFNFAPRQMRAGTAGDASLLGWILHTVALGTGLNDQAPLIARIPKGLAHFVGDRGRFGHFAPLALLQSIYSSCQIGLRFAAQAFAATLQNKKK